MSGSLSDATTVRCLDIFKMIAGKKRESDRNGGKCHKLYLTHNNKWIKQGQEMRMVSRL